MKYFFDTEFIEDGNTIDLISIGIISEDGREYYAINWDCRLECASQWVIDNVLKKAGGRGQKAEGTIRRGFRPRPIVSTV
ncbi:MAG: 3'-5' exoribonuclease [Richelia sp. RM1_1_1]|nr:3'-5' exoribonuclease [Richelia sp. RM1_1_1]